MAWYYWLLLADFIFWLISPFLLWWRFLGVINLAAVQQRKGLTKLQYRLGVPYAFVSIVLDIYVNIFWGTFIFWQWPNYKRLTLSARMDDLIKNHTGWRKQRALVIVGELLEDFDETGQHSTYGLYSKQG